MPTGSDRRKDGRDPLDVAVGRRLRDIRKRRRLAQDALAARAGIAFRHLRNYESGVARVGPATLVRMASILDVPIFSFFIDGRIGASRG